MVDFQNGGLDIQVYELILKMCDLCCSEEFPRFKTEEIKNGWKCILSIPGVKEDSVAYGSTEAQAINRCASGMLFILKKYHENDEHYTEFEDSVFKDRIEEYFGSRKYDFAYRYRLSICDILLDSDDTNTKTILQKYASSSLDSIKESGSEIEDMSEIVTLRFLVKQKKKFFC